MNLDSVYRYSGNQSEVLGYRDYSPTAVTGTDARDEEGRSIDDGELVFSREWNGLYTRREIDYLDDYYAQLEEGFVLDNQNIQDYARKAAKAS